MTTTQNLVDRVYSRLQTKLTRNKLASAISDTTSTSYSFTYDLGRIAAGSKISVGLEDNGVWAVDSTAKTATVQRGDFGSSAATHQSGDVVLVEPPYTPFEILTVINAELNALPGLGVPQFQTVEFTSSAPIEGYNLTSVTGLRRVWRVSYKELGNAVDWDIVPSSQWNVQQKANTTDFASGNALFVYGHMDPGCTVRVLYTSNYTPLSSLSDNVATVAGLPADFHDILVVGACYRLLSGRPADRTTTDAQGDARRAGEVSTSDQVAAVRPFLAERGELIQAAKSALLAEYGLGR